MLKTMAFEIGKLYQTNFRSIRGLPTELELFKNYEDAQKEMQAYVGLQVDFEIVDFEIGAEPFYDVDCCTFVVVNYMQLEDYRGNQYMICAYVLEYNGFMVFTTDSAVAQASTEIS